MFSIDSILIAPQPTTLICIIPLSAFLWKKDLLHQSLYCAPSFDPSIDITCSAVFYLLEPVSLEVLTDVVSQLLAVVSKSSSCPIDPIPTNIFKEVWGAIGPNVLRIINSNLTLGSVPSFFKQTVVVPLLKKPMWTLLSLLITDQSQSFPLYLKCLKRLYSVKLHSFLNEHNILDIFQLVLKHFIVPNLHL